VSTWIRLACLSIALVIVAACTAGPAGGSPSAATSAAPSAAASASAAVSAEPSAAASAGTMSLSALEGQWTFEASNPRLASATGDHAGGTVTINGDRLLFEAGDYRSDQPLPISGGPISVECDDTLCTFDGVPLVGIAEVDGQLRLVSVMSLSPIGLGDACDWQDVPDAGLVDVESDGTTPPSSFSFVSAVGGGTGQDGCSGGTHVLAWDTIATRVS
jgi:hypothetical protein